MLEWHVLLSVVQVVGDVKRLVWFKKICSYAFLFCWVVFVFQVCFVLGEVSNSVRAGSICVT